MSFDRFSICLGYYFYALHYHFGQGSPEYKILGRLEKLGFKPGGIKFECLADSDPQALEVYDNLVKKHHS